jgi:hypothetical protein
MSQQRHLYLSLGQKQKEVILMLIFMDTHGLYTEDTHNIKEIYGNINL